MNPIIGRELIGLLRTRRAVAVQGGLALATAALVLARWPTGGVSDLSGAAAVQVLRVLGYGLLASVVLVLPAFPATALVRERVRGTLALLLNTPLTPTAIYAGKLGGVLGYTAVLLLMTAPAAAACYTLGGSSTGGGVGLLYLAAAAAAVQITALGLYVSGRALSTDAALRITYAEVLAVCVLPLVVHYLVPRDVPVLASAANWVACISPVPAVMEAVGHGGVGIPGTDPPGGVAVRYLIVSLPLSGLLAWRTVRGLARSPLDRPRPAGVMTQDRTRRERVARRLFYLIDPQRRTGSTGGLLHPVMVKEFRTRRFGRSHWTLRLLAGAVVLSLALGCLAALGALGWGIEVVGGAMVLLQAAALLLFAPSLSAGLIAAEREGGGWNLLRMTPMSAASVLVGKLLAAAWPVVLLYAATLPGYGVMVAVQPESAHPVMRVLVCQGLTAALAVLIGAAASSVFRSTAAATAAAYLTLAAVCVAPLLVWLGRDAPFGRSTVQAALTLDPVAAALSAVGMPGFDGYDLLPANWWVIGGTCVALLALLVARTWRLTRPD
jgi:ABC-type transport system involved in multi-copper enzyme maturation permease subunit